MNTAIFQKTFSAVFITLLLVLGFSTKAFAQTSTTAPNFGSPIIVDGDYADWNLDADIYADPDFYSRMYRYPDYIIHEANAFLRYNYNPITDTGTLYVLVLTVADHANVTTDPAYSSVLVNGAVPPGFVREFIDGPGDYAWGWEASFPLSYGQYNINIRTQVENNGLHLVKLPVTFYPFDLYRWDYGDLPDSYNTTIAANGPRHQAGILRLGRLVDGEVDGQPGTNPVLDDLVARNDEDGVIALNNWRNGIPTIQYTVSGCTGECYLSAWIDWGRLDGTSGTWIPDGTFGITDTLFINEPVINGTDTFTFTIPTGVGFAATFNTRFRLCDNQISCATPYAASAEDAPFGEVEDYQWSFDPTAVTINSFTATSTQNANIPFIIAGSVAAILFTGLISLFSKRQKREVFNT